jgi:hypothetical protein
MRWLLIFAGLLAGFSGVAAMALLVPIVPEARLYGPVLLIIAAILFGAGAICSEIVQLRRAVESREP